ncbi:MAG: FxLYD domain-containing protein [Spirochaetes bacterium]|jgi:hypothetical protein|nr:FxLYD domain-containing protein [Spirochaetota bacterium]
MHDASGKILVSGYGYGTRSFLLPGEKTVIRALITKAPDYDHFTVEYTPKAPSVHTQVNRMKMAVISSQMEFSGNGRLDIIGTVKNNDNRNCSSFKLQALVYRDGNIIGSGLEVWTSNVAPSQQVPFSMYIPMAIDAADSYVIDISGEPAL